MSNREEAQKFFSRHAAAYTLAGHPNVGDLERMLALVEPTGREVALDVATAAGNTSLLLAPLVAGVVGLDLTVEMGREFAVQMRSKGVRNAWFTAGDVERLPFSDSSFDLVVCRRAAHHFTRPDLALAEMARVLRSGGRLGLADMMAPEGPAADLFNGMERARDGSHFRALGASQWRRVVEDAGLEVMALETSLEEREFSNWLFPVPADGSEAAGALALAEAAPPDVASQVVRHGQQVILFLKGRIVLVAVKR